MHPGDNIVVSETSKNISIVGSSWSTIRKFHLPTMSDWLLHSNAHVYMSE